MQEHPHTWYRRNYPAGYDCDPRIMEILSRLGRGLHNLPRTGQQRLDGGFRQCGKGIEVRLRRGFTISSFDMDELTRLVLDAHRLHCRVELSAMMNMLIVRVHPREAEAEHLWGRHPGLDDLSALIGRLTPSIAAS